MALDLLPDVMLMSISAFSFLLIIHEINLITEYIEYLQDSDSTSILASLIFCFTSLITQAVFHRRVRNVTGYCACLPNEQKHVINSLRV
jgi:hypothetical protein